VDEVRHCDREPKAWREATQSRAECVCHAAQGCFVAPLLAMTAKEGITTGPIFA